MRLATHADLVDEIERAISVQRTSEHDEMGIHDIETVAYIAMLLQENPHLVTSQEEALGHALPALGIFPNRRGAPR